MAESKVVPVNIRDEMHKSYLLYAMSVIVGRALPDVRDGLKPVQRRILFGMFDMGMYPDRPYKKSARIAGDVMGRFHPHGDSSIYDTMVRMAQSFSYRYPLVDGHGNYGSVDGDPAAAMRYTEARLSRLAMELLRDIDKETVDFVPNYDNSEREPVVLPSRFPNLLLNGSEGIAVGMATSIPPHNLGELIDATIHQIDNPDTSIDELMTYLPGPDFPTAGLILGTEGIKQAYRTGRGSVKLRSRCEIESLSNGKNRIIITEIPFKVNKAETVEKIAELSKDKVIDGITGLRDESDRTGTRVVIELRRDANPNTVLNQLFKHTQLEKNFSVNMLVLVNNEPRTLNIKEILHYYIEHQKEIITRRTIHDLKKAEDRAHLLEGLRIALDNLDEVIALIRASQNGETAKTALIDRFGFTERQATAILDLRLQRLTALEIDKIEEEYRQIKALIEELKSILADINKVLSIIKTELTEIKAKFNNPRLTEITQPVSELADEDLISEEDIVITLTHRGYIKRLPLATYKSQKRGGKGITGATTRDEDFVEQLFVTTTHHNVLFFTNKGKVYTLKAYTIPESGRQARGQAVVNLVQLDPDEVINTIIPVKDFSAENIFLTMCTREGIIKKTQLSEFSNARKNGLIAVNLDDTDELVSVKMTDGNRHVFIVTKNGQAIRFEEAEVRSMGRTARGVKAISLNNDDHVIGMDIAGDTGYLLVATRNGFGKRTPLSDYRLTARGGKGIRTMQLTKKNGPIIGFKIVDENDELVLVTTEGLIIRLAVKDISQQGRSTQGVTLIRLSDGDSLIAIAKVLGKDDEDIVIEDDLTIE